MSAKPGRRRWIAALLFAVVGPPTATAAVGEELAVSTLDWPPYTSPALPAGGAVTQIVTDAFAAVDIEATVLTLPWKRAISRAKDDAGVVAYFPGYHCRHVEGFVPSEPIGFGPLGFVENVDAPITWRSIDDLGEQQLQIGTVLGYANTDEFDEKAGTGWIKVVPAADDLTNLRKLLRKRIDAAVIDKLVLSYLLATESSIADGRTTLVFDERPLEEKTLHLCFNDTAEGHALRARFNEGLARIDVEGTIERYFLEQF